MLLIVFYCFLITLLLATHYWVTLFSNTCQKNIYYINIYIPFSVMHEHLTIWLSAVSFLVVCLLFFHWTQWWLTCFHAAYPSPPPFSWNHASSFDKIYTCTTLKTEHFTLWIMTWDGVQSNLLTDTSTCIRWTPSHLIHPSHLSDTTNPRHPSQCIHPSYASHSSYIS